MSISDGMGEHWGTYLSKVYAELGGILKRVIEVTKKIAGKIKKILIPKYIDVKFKIPVEQLSFVKPHAKVIDVSQLVFEEEPLLSWADLIKFGKRNKRKP